MDKKVERKLQNELMQSNFLKIIAYVLLIISVVTAYSNYYWCKTGVEDISITLLGINLAVISINIATYMDIAKQLVKEIEKAKELDDELSYYYIKIQRKRNNLALIQLFIGILMVIISAVFILFDVPIILKNALGFGCLISVLEFLFQSSLSILSFYKIHIQGEK